MASSLPPLSNFPLPGELREQIYDLLFGVLHDDLTPQPASMGSVQPFYEFYTPILEMNKTIRHEATGYLLKMHQFILLDFDPWYTELLETIRLPVVKVHRPRDFQSHILSLTLGFESVNNDSEWLYPEGLDRHANIMLLRDFPLLCTGLSFYSLHTAPSYLAIDCARGSQPMTLQEPPAGQWPLVMAIDLTFRNDGRIAESRKVECGVLECTRQIVGGCNRVNLKGFTDLSAVGTVMRSMTPRLVWLRAQGWHTLDVMARIKQQADRYALSRREIQDAMAFRLYALLIRTPVEMENRPPTDLGYDTAYSQARHYLGFLEMDVALSAMQLLLKHRWTDLAGPAVDIITRVESPPQHTEDIWITVSLANHIQHFLSVPSRPSDEHKAAQLNLKAFVEYVEDHFDTVVDDGLQRTLALAKEVLTTTLSTFAQQTVGR